jgi:hypothetical protein
MPMSLPAMSIVLVTPDRYQGLRQTVKRLRKQSARAQLELVIVGPSAAKLDIDAEELGVFCQFRIAEANPAKSIPAAKAAGIRAASASVVVMGEDHCYPRPGWAEALIKAHEQPWGAIGPVLWNANPSLISWANFFVAYGPWIGPITSGVISSLSEHNSSYKRALLLEYDSCLETMLERESKLHQELQKRGYQLYLESKAEADHFNFSQLGISIVLRFCAGRAYGAMRARANAWSAWRRIIYAGGVMLIPFVRLRHVLREIRRTKRQKELVPRILPALLALLTATAFGEAAGYLLGIGDTQRQLDRFEFSGALLDQPSRQ